MAAAAIFTATITATTAAVSGADKTTALLSGFSAALRKELGEGGTLSVRQQNHIDTAIANAVANAADFMTALGLS